MKITKNCRGSALLEVAIGIAILSMLSVGITLMVINQLRFMAESRRDAERASRAEAAVAVISSWVARSGTPLIFPVRTSLTESSTGSALQVSINGTNTSWFWLNGNNFTLDCADGSSIILSQRAFPTAGVPLFQRSALSSPWDDVDAVGTVVYADAFSGTGLVVVDFTIPSQNLRVRRGLATLGL